MIIARKINSEKEEEVLKNILRQYNINDEHKDNDVTYILLLDDKIVGVCKLTCYHDIGILKYIVIDKKETGQDLGDALLRSALNYCFRNNISRVYYKTIDDYLIKKGFEKNKNYLKNVEHEEEYLLEVNLERFFNRPCKSSGGR
ncbi:GCN5-like N-acetyltransferase [Gottschalkia acidurici 9a]|uniref:GCN5-like N-acetyltransferase n=1 Tax=Gottschalkia acidurici (strain ATCC 7906 / DSM 604 / BCRC 14475 / CIP 104303 / KCTC 5404 / NCIMB 10678 / 9a) TaxID=1128398 RepID=K0AYW5_GOTA9|nr:GNAT family N-acetyltransferase [Gottschalkia acidurici]AFS78439.1 GCN5-like N-acetyltransferase [Gottschalkia acidurici 9a]